MTAIREIRKHCAVTAVAGTLLLGIALAQDVGDTTASALAVQQAEAAVRVTTMQRDLRRRELEIARAAVRAGSGQPLAAVAAEAELATAERELAVALVDLDEVSASGRPVRREISAPRIGDRDFVSERLRTELEWLEAAAPAADERVRVADVRVRAGVAAPGELTNAAVDRERYRAGADRVRALLSLRDRFLAREIGAEEAELTQQALLEAERERVMRAEFDRAQAGDATRR